MAKAKYTKDNKGYFQTKVWDGSYSDGKKHYITLRTKKGSRTLENMVNEHKQNIWERKYVRQADILFLEYARKWKEVYKYGQSGNTLSMYENIIEKHLIAVQCKISDVNRMHYHMLINSITGNRTKQQVSMTFKQIIKSAIKDNLLPPIAYDDIFADASPIKYKAPEKRALTESEKDAVFKADLNLSDKVFLYILYGCGLRRGEALALTRFDISMERRELTVSKALAFEGNNPYLKCTKTSNGERTVPIPGMVWETIEEYVKSIKGTILFTSKSNGYLSKSSYRKMWDRILRNMGEVSKEPIEGLTAHIFRHNYCASLCYKIPEISIRKVAELMGDTDKMVIDVYNHVISSKENPHEVVANALAL